MMLLIKQKRRSVGALLVALAFATGLGMARTHPATALTLELVPNTVFLEPGQQVNLTATADQDVTEPLHILIYDEFGAFLEGQCDPPVRSCPVSIIRNGPVIGTSFVAFAANLGGRNTFPPDNIQATSNEVHPSWMNPLKLYAWRPSVGSAAIDLLTDSGGARIFSPYVLELFKVSCSPACSMGQARARVGKVCPGGSRGITECSTADGDTSAVTYQAILSLGAADVDTARNNDARAASCFKCVEPSDSTAPTLCVQKKDPLTGGN